MEKLELQAYQQKAGFAFNDLSLLMRALTHPSYLNEHPKEGLEDNQRLEYLGDAVLDFISSEWLYHRFPEAPEGRLTRLRSGLVRTEAFAALAKQCYIGEALMLGRGEEESGGRERAGNLCAAFEALMGALYLDQGVEVVSLYVEPLFSVALDDILQAESDKDAKSRFQEWSQANMGLTPRYATIASRGPDHEKEFTVGVYIGETCYAEGVGSSKQSAAQSAAKQALVKNQDQDNKA